MPELLDEALRGNRLAMKEEVGEKRLLSRPAEHEPLAVVPNLDGAKHLELHRASEADATSDL